MSKTAESMALLKDGSVVVSLRSQGASVALFCLAATAFLVVPVRNFGADQSAGTRLDTYFRRLNYEGMNFRLDKDNQPLLDGEVGGQKCALLMDSGWGMTTLKGSAAKGLKTLDELGVVLEDSVLGPLTNSSLVLVEKLVLGRAQFLNQPAKVEKLKADFIRLRFDGILGCDFFLRNHCLIDCGAQRIYFRSAKPSEQQSDALTQTLRRSGFIEIAIKLDDGLNIDARLNGEPVRLLLDTGSSLSLLDEAEAKRFSLNSIRHDQPELGTYIREDINVRIVGMGSIGAHQGWVATLRSLQIGSREWKDIHFGVTNLRAWGIEQLASAGQKVQGFLGMHLLMGEGALIDFASGKLWLRPDKPPQNAKTIAEKAPGH